MKRGRIDANLCLAFAVIVFGCSVNTKPKDMGSGSASVRVLTSALSAMDVERIQVTVSGPGIEPDIVTELAGTPGEGEWSGTISDIPEGDGRILLAEAFNGEDELIYSGSTQGVTIVEGETVSVSIFLQQIDPPNAYSNTVPIIISLVVSSNHVAPGSKVTFAVFATDADSEDTLSYLWTCENGSFSDPDEPSTEWTAPMIEGSYTIAVEVSDPHGSTAILSVDIQVDDDVAGMGEANVTLVINTSPEVQNIVPTPTRIGVGESTQLDLTASDPDEDELSFSWTSNCDGEFSNPNIEDPSFTLLNESTTGRCTLVGAISDGRGGSNTASITIETSTGTILELHTCKTSGWQANTRYQISEDIREISEDCFVIDQPGVILEGNHYNLSSTRGQDVIFYQNGIERPTVYRNQTFSKNASMWVPIWTPPYSMTDYTTSLNAADIDADGDLDLVLPAYNEQLRVYENAGDGDFGTASVFDIGGGMGYDCNRWLDFDLDGDIDFFVVHDGGDERFYRGTGSTSSFTLAYSESLGTYTHFLEIGNFDNDNKIDIVTGNHLSGPRMRLNALTPSGGTFLPGWENDLGGIREMADTIADFNGDNTYDLLASTTADDWGTMVYLGNGTGTQFELVWSQWATWPVCAVDIDADNDTDLIVKLMADVYRPSDVEIHLNDENANFTLFHTFYDKRIIAVADLNQDDLLDLMFSATADTPSNAAVEVWVNEGFGQFKHIWSSTETGRASDTELRDYDNDGDLDGMLVINGLEGVTYPRIVYIENDGSGQYSEAWIEQATDMTGYRLYSLGDLDGPPATAIVIKAPNVTIRNIGNIIGFSTGVSVLDNNARIENVAVSGFDLYGISIEDSENTFIQGLTTRHFYRGTGVSFRHSKNSTLEDSKLCDAGFHRSLSRISINCVNSSGLSGSNNQLKLNNGCQEVSDGTVGWTTCK